jgi:hypothetical protein
MMDAQDIECPRCHRIDFGWKPRHSCEECHWTIRPDPVAKPYGFDVLIELRRPNGLTDQTAERHYKGSESKARSRAKTAPGFSRVLAVVPLSEERWLRTYGEGRM